MSETQAEPLDIRAVIARIDRDIAETSKLRSESEKFVAEQRKLISELIKLASEQTKLDAEARKLNRDRGLAPWLAVVGLIGGLLAIANFAATFLRGH
jgi:hypothetical protein